MDPIIEIHELWKQYRIGPDARKYRSLRDTLTMRNRATSTIWALKNIQASIAAGSRIGVIGNNGAGKSTLLKLIGKITYPTKGQITLRGRVASLLEVGTGFHPELTGRENIFFNGSVLGMARGEIKRKFDEIIDFSGVGRFIDTPLKHYSSGMQLRLAFAVAAHLEPEILLIDEVLAVGDAEFQKKCIGKMQEISTSEGRTLVFVSHNMQSILDLTEECILLRDGELTMRGPSREVVANYLSQRDAVLTYQNPGEHIEGPYIASVSLETSLGNHIQEHGKPMTVCFEIVHREPIRRPALSYQILNGLHQPIIHHLNLGTEIPFAQTAGRTLLRSEIPSVSLYPGNYSLRVHFADAASRIKFETLEDICPFRVELSSGLREYYWDPGTALVTEENRWIVEEKPGG